MSIIDIWKNEPALVLGAVNAIVALVVAFGLSLSTGQIGAIAAVAAAITALVVRSQVSPVNPTPPVVATPPSPTP